MLRTVVGTTITLIAFGFAPPLGIASAVIAGVWVVLGIGAVVKAAVELPTEHHVQVQGVVAHVVVPTHVHFEEAGANDEYLLPSHSEGEIIECPRCSQFVFPPTTVCNCGCVVRSRPRPERQKVLARGTEVVEWDNTEGASQQARQRMTCPACPECRAPTRWVAQFERYLCVRCDAYL